MIQHSWIKPWVLKYTTRGQKLYDGCVFSQIPSSSRGQLFTLIARDYYDEFIGPTSGPCRSELYENGASPYDFLDTSTRFRVEVKSSQLRWTQMQKKSDSNWKFTFSSVNLQKFDRLLLLGYFPKKVFLWEWDGVTGFSTSGKMHKIRGGSVHLHCYREHVCSDTFPISPGKLLNCFLIDDLTERYALQ